MDDPLRPADAARRCTVGRAGEKDEEDADDDGAPPLVLAPASGPRGPRRRPAEAVRRFEGVDEAATGGLGSAVTGGGGPGLPKESLGTVAPLGLEGCCGTVAFVADAALDMDAFALIASTAAAFGVCAVEALRGPDDERGVRAATATGGGLRGIDDDVAAPLAAPAGLR